jgi:hypothetical protein
MFTSMLCALVIAAGPELSQSEVEHQQDSSAAAQEHPFSCAHNALYVLLRLLNRPATLDQVKMKVHVGENGESSMAELEQAARQFGVLLSGRRLGGKDFAELDMPLIVLLQNPSTLHGHYVVSRWIDDRHTLQALDAPKEPYLIPNTDVVGYEGPALACLVPTRREATIWRGIGALSLGVSALVIFAAVWRFRGDLSRSLRLRRSPAA